MRSTTLQFGSSIMGTVGAVMLAVSLFSSAPYLFADEPINDVKNYCDFNCNESTEGYACANGGCGSLDVKCENCCECGYSNESNAWVCFDTTECDE
jgi:hypothetical protein